MVLGRVLSSVAMALALSGAALAQQGNPTCRVADGRGTEEEGEVGYFKPMT